MNIYVAGKWSERERVRNLMDMLESRKHIITCDWTKHVAPERIQSGSGCFNKDFDWAQNGHKTYAEEDLEGVRNCDIVVALMTNPEIFYKGAWIEVGIAIGLNKKIILIGNDIATVFLGLENIKVVQYKEEALTIIDSLQFDIEHQQLLSSVHDTGYDGSYHNNL